MNQTNEIFTLSHRERMATELREMLTDAVDKIGRCSGRIGSVCNEIKLEGAPKEQVIGAIAGVRELMVTLHAWITERFPGAEEFGEEAGKLCARHGVSYELINVELDGAEGEFLFRRDGASAKHAAFPGRYRKLNSLIWELRNIRSAINSPLPAGERETFHARYEEWQQACDKLADAWMRGSFRSVLQKDFCGWYPRYAGKDDAERDAACRLGREVEALDALCRRRRDAAFSRRLENIAPGRMAA